MSEPFVWPVRVYYEDTDAGGVVYNANYLKFMERARTEWLRSLGVEQDVLIARDSVLFAVTRVEIDFRRPARFNELIAVTVEIAQRRQASMTFHQEIRSRDDTVLYCSGRIQVACLDAARFRPRPLPKGFLTEMLSEH